MKKPLRTLSYALLSAGFVAIIIIFTTNLIIENKLKNYVKTALPENLDALYESLSVNVLNGSVSLGSPSLTIRNQKDSIKHTFINAEKLKISGISYWSYLINNEIKLDEIFIEDPEIKFYKDRKKSDKDSISQKSLELDKPIYLDLLKIDKAKISIYEAGKDSIKLSTKKLFIKAGEITVNNNTLKQKIPFKYENIEAIGDTVFVKASDFENLTIANFSLKNNNAIFNTLEFKTKYSKAKLTEIIKVERDHYNLALKSLSVNYFDFGYTNDKLFTKSGEIVLNSPTLHIFRDKLAPDDLSEKPLYSKSLRELPFQLTVDSIKVNNGYLEYEEKVNKDNNGGSINFKDLNATFLNVSNTYKSPIKTELNINALFMGNTPYTTKWTFDVQDPSDSFLFAGRLGVLEAEKMNSFTEPNLKVKLEGKVDKAFFTIDGNHSTSKTDMKINYSNFKISVLKSNGEKKDKFLSTIVNVFVSKNSDKKDSQFKEGSAEATRDKTKSIFNFIWISVKNALQKCVTI